MDTKGVQDVMVEVMGEVKNKIFFETMEKRIWYMDSQEKWLKLGTNKKNKSNFRIGNIALDQFFCNCLRSQKAKRNYNTDWTSIGSNNNNYKKMWCKRKT